MDNFKELEFKIRDILDRNHFVNQKIDLSTIPIPNPNQPLQDAFRIRVMSPPLRFSVEIVKPIPLKDFLIIAGRLNIAPEHLSLINSMELDQRMDLFEEIRFELTKKDINSNFVEQNGQILGIECMNSIFISASEEELARQLFSGMEEINNAFFLVIIILQRFLRKAGFNANIKTQSEAKSFYQ